MSYYHILAPVDCTDDALRAMLPLLQYASKMPCCKVTLAAAVTPAPTAKIREKKREHAQGALNRLHDYLSSFGLFTFQRIVEARDPADAYVAETRDYDEQYDVIVLSPYQTRPEDPFDLPCTGSLADRISKNAEIPVVILPYRQERMPL